jgi:hypothetical protein
MEETSTESGAVVDVTVQMLKDVLREMRIVRELLLNMPAERPEQMRRYLYGRYQAILAGETPVPVLPGPKLVLHVLPHSAFDGLGASPDLGAAKLGGYSGYDCEGRFTWSGRPDDVRTILHFDKRGHIETVTRAQHNGYKGEPPSVDVRDLERTIRERLSQAVTVLESTGVQGRADVAVALLQARGMRASGLGMYDSRDYFNVNSDLAVLPSFSFDLAAPREALPDLLRPALDGLWQVCGWPRCLSYAADGTYQPTY